MAQSTKRKLMKVSDIPAFVYEIVETAATSARSATTNTSSETQSCHSTNRKRYAVSWTRSKTGDHFPGFPVIFGSIRVSVPALGSFCGFAGGSVSPQAFSAIRGQRTCPSSTLSVKWHQAGRTPASFLSVRCSVPLLTLR